MKTLKFWILLCVLIGFAVNAAQAQAVILTEDQNDGRIPNFWSYYDGGWHQYISTDWQVVITPSGNINGIFIFYLNPEDPKVPENGSNTFIMNWGMKDNEGIMHLTTGFAIVTADGIMKLVAHYKPEKEE